MKTLQLFILASILFFGQSALAQTKTEKIDVAGSCGTCKKKIEGAAKKAGASYASWNIDTKVLTVKYNSQSANTAKIEQAIAAVGYDTPDYKASDDVYDHLDECCKYERKSSAGKTADQACMKDGHCLKDMSCCKDNGGAEKACCKKS